MKVLESLGSNPSQSTRIFSRVSCVNVKLNAGGERGGVYFQNFWWGAWLRCPKPDPISDQNIQFSGV